MVLVGRVARTHGIRGQVIVNPETDFPEERFREGAVLYVRRHAATEPLMVRTVRFHQGRPILAFEGIASIDDAEWLKGAELRVPEGTLHRLPADQFYRHDLVGCLVQTTDGREVGVVMDVVGTREVSHLLVKKGRHEVILPLAADICIEIDTDARRIVIAPPEGLLGLNETGG
jgi:16S rRNA processing protein RimM